MTNRLVTIVALGLLMAAPALAAPHEDRQGGKHQAAAPHNAQHAVRANTHVRAPARAMNTRVLPRAVPSRAAVNTVRVQKRVRAIAPRVAIAEKHAPSNIRGNAASRRNVMRQNNSKPVRTAVSHVRARSHPTIASLRINVQSSRHFHNGDYRAPQGYQPRHWSHGDHLPRGYYARDYWLSDFLTFGLFAPPPGLVWVRVGNDALLVDEISGDIVQVDYGVFY